MKKWLRIFIRKEVPLQISKRRRSQNLFYTLFTYVNRQTLRIEVENVLHLYPLVWLIYRCTHRISSVNACVYLSAKVLVSFETSKHSSYFLAPLSYAVPGHARQEPTPSQTKLHVAQRVRPARKNNPS